MMRALAITIVAAACSHAIIAPATGQMDEPFEADAKAVEAFKEMLDSYRERPALKVESTLTIELREGDTVTKSEEVKAVFTYGSVGAGIIEINDYTCRFSDGMCWFR